MVGLAVATLLTTVLLVSTLGPSLGQSGPRWTGLGSAWGLGTGGGTAWSSPTSRSPQYYQDPVQGPQVKASRGGVWPLPSAVHDTDSSRVLVRAASFQFAVTGDPCEILQAAVTRYLAILRREAAVRLHRRSYSRSSSRADPGHRAPELSSLLISPGRCESLPYPDMDESYYLTISKSDTVSRRPFARLSSSTVWGALRGLETFVQLMVPTGDGSTLTVNTTTVSDAPRFPHRGLLIDTSRHFLPVEDIKLVVSAMAAVKMNVLHWHIVDDQSFPWQSVHFPELSERGAYDSLQVYTPNDVQEVIEHARLHGIRVIPEFDTPGHTRSWGAGRPGLLASCHDSFGPTGYQSNIDPTKQANLRFLRKLFSEITSAFPDPMIHLGGDEVSPPCWNTDPSVLAYMENRNMTGDYPRLQFEYLRWLTSEVRAMNRTSIVWQEAWQNGDFRPDEVVVQVWLGHAMPLMKNITSYGFRALLSESWYLDNLSQSWQRMYAVDPQDFPGSPQQLALVSGGEACMWGEMVDATNVHQRIWPRAAAVAERLWSPRGSTGPRTATARIEELVCRLRRRGVPASPPNGPGYCPE